MTGKRLAALIGLRDHARRVLQSQNEGWPEATATTPAASSTGPMTASSPPTARSTRPPSRETTDGSVIRRMPNLVKFREDPDAMLVMSLEDYDEVTGKATKAAIMLQDVVGKTPPITARHAAPRKGCWSRSTATAAVDLPFIAELYGKPEEQIIAELGDLIYHDPESKTWQTADAYLSGNVREKLRHAEAAGPATPATPRPCGPCSPRTCCPATSTPISVRRGYRRATSRRSPPSCSTSRRPAITIGHLKKDAVWSVEAGYAAEASVAATAEYGTPRANGTGCSSWRST